MIVSVTERATFKRCRRKWHLESSNRRALMPMVPATALALGTFVHAALAEWLVSYGVTDKHPKITFLEAARDERQRVINAYHTQKGFDIEPGALAEIDDAITLGYSMIENYVTRWGSPLPDTMTLLQAEQRVLMPIPGTEHQQEWLWDADTQTMREHWYPDMRMHYLQGRLDGIIRDTNGRLYVLEHKSYAQRPKEEVLRSTDQFVAYQWLLEQLDMGTVAGVAYDGLWKRAAPPKRVDDHTGVLQDLFCRMRIEHAPEAVAEFQEFLRDEVLEMASNPNAYTNRTSDGSCFWGCGMERLCAAMTRGEDTEYILNTYYTPKPDANVDAIDTKDE